MQTWYCWETICRKCWAVRTAAQSIWNTSLSKLYLYVRIACLSRDYSNQHCISWPGINIHIACTLDSCRNALTYEQYSHIHWYEQVVCVSCSSGDSSAGRAEDCRWMHCAVILRSVVQIRLAGTVILFSNYLNCTQPQNSQPVPYASDSSSEMCTIADAPIIWQCMSGHFEILTWTWTVPITNAIHSELEQFAIRISCDC